MAKEKATISATLGHEYEDLEEREDFLANNADSVEKMEFVKRFNSDELMKKKDLFALQSARASDIEEEIKDFREQKKAELKPISRRRFLLSLRKSSRRAVWLTRRFTSSLTVILR